MLYRSPAEAIVADYVKMIHMNKRAYYFDAYTVEFEAEVVERLMMKGHQTIVLDRTYFYPTSGGQPHDTGQINEVAVVDIQIRDEDGAILHFLEGKCDQDQVSATINWQRRFDNMQHHTGQHILSQAFIQVAEAQTIGFHLSDTSVTIDLDKQNLSEDEIIRAEKLANKIVWQDRPVTVREVSMAAAKSLPLRKIPPTQNGKLRLIDITDFDLTACGGTHVSRTGEVGVIKVIKHERRGEKQRIEFRCGKRALNDYGQKHMIVTKLASRLTTGGSELDASVERLQDENKQIRRLLKRQKQEIAQLEASHCIDQAMRIGDTLIIAEVLSDRDPGQLRALGSQLIQKEGVIALLGVTGDRSHLLFNRSESAPGQMNQILKSALSVLGSKSGGGSAAFAQGVGPAASKDRVMQAIKTAKNQLLEEIESMR